MFAFPLLRNRHSRPFAFRLDFGVAHARLQLQQLQLRVAELLAARTVLVDPLQPQPFFQDLDLQVCPLQFPRQLGNLLGLGRGGSGECIVHDK